VIVATRARPISPLPDAMTQKRRSQRQAVSRWIEWLCGLDLNLHL
jgi:hypothetical protein